MTPKQRQQAILETIRSHQVKNLRLLSKLLAERGFVTSQATLSRDIAEMGLVKGPDGYTLAVSGGRELTSSQMVKKLSQVHLQDRAMLRRTVFSVEVVDHHVIVKTAPSAADATTDILDEMGWSEVVGTIGGFDTILITTRSESQAKIVVKKIQQLIK